MAVGYVGGSNIGSSDAGALQYTYAGTEVNATWMWLTSGKINYSIDGNSRLTNLSYDTQTWGSFIPYTWGTARIRGAMVWASPFRERMIVDSWQKGNIATDGQKFNVNVKYDYTVDCGYSFGYNGSPGKKRYLSRVYMNNAIVYDYAGGYRYPGISFSWYDGQLDQMPAAPYVKDKGADAVAFRGQMTLFIQNLPIKDFGAALPEVWAEIVEEDDVFGAFEPFDRTISSFSDGPASFISIDWVRRRLYQPLNSFGGVADKPGISVYDLDARTEIGSYPLTNFTGPNMPWTDWKYIPWMQVLVGNFSLNGEVRVIEADTGRELQFLDKLSPSIDINLPGSIEVSPASDSEGGAWFAALVFSPFTVPVCYVGKLTRYGVYTGQYVYPNVDSGWTYDAVFGDEGLPYFYIAMRNTGGTGVSVARVDCDAGTYDNRWIDVPLHPTWTGPQINYITNYNGLVVVNFNYTNGGQSRSEWVSFDSETKAEIWRTQDPALSSQNPRAMRESNLQGGTIGWYSGGNTKILDLMSGTLTVTHTGIENTNGLWDSDTRTVYASAFSYEERRPFRSYAVPGPAQEIRLDRFIADVLRLAGYTDDQFIIIGVNDTIEGAFINKGYDAIRMLDDVCALHRISRTESDGRLRFQKKTQDENAVEPEISIDYADLAWLSEGEDNRTAMRMSMASEVDTPVEVNVQFINPDLSYVDDSYTYRRPGLVTASKSQMGLAVPLMMSKERVAYLTQNMLYDVWGGQLTGSIRLPRSFYDIDEGTIVRLTHKSFDDTVRITETTHNGDWSVSANFELVRAKRAARGRADDYVSNMPKPKGRPESELYLFDTPLLTPDDAVDGHLVVYMTMSGIGQPYWPGGYIANAADTENAAWSAISNFNDDSSIGRALTVLPPSLVTANGLTVNFKGVNPFEGQDATLDELLADPGRNLAFYGVNGRWEIVQWQTATLVRGSVVFDGVRRGQRGSITTGHQTGDRFIPLSVNIRKVAFPLSVLGTTQLFKAVGYGLLLDRVPTYEFVMSAAALRPWSPIVHRIGDRQSNGDIVVNWYRRDRLGTPQLGNPDPLPLSDEPEAYDLEVVSPAGTIARTVAGLSAPVWTYTAAMQAADGLVGTPDAVRIRVYQLSATIGRGTPGEDTVYVD